MQRYRLRSTLAALLATVTLGGAAAQPPAGQPAQQPPQPTQTFQQQQPQPLLVVPSLVPPAPAAPRISPDLPTVELAPLLERVERSSGKRFLVDSRLGTRLYLAGVEPNDVTYPVLLAILRANGFAAFESEGYVNIVPDANIRFHAPLVQTDDASIPAELYVTRVLATTHIPTAYLVPILRPLLPQSAHLASSQTGNQLIVMDRYENVQRIAEIIRTLDVPGAPPLVRD
jgi:general secretion pathway protein D